MDFDLIISGGGPAGLCLARALSGCGLRLAVVEQQPLASLENPAFDGREIALTQHSAQLMRALGLWERIEPHALSPLRDARVLNGPSPFAMVIGHGLGKHSELGWLVSNHLIRRAAFEAVQESLQKNGDITLIAGETVASVRTDRGVAHVTLASGATLQARLLVAADSRFSTTRRAMGIAADLHDLTRPRGCAILLEARSHGEGHACFRAEPVRWRRGSSFLPSAHRCVPGPTRGGRSRTTPGSPSTRATRR
jgi:2-polyprenyl-6-methoxyphenol hydroxylase-like FAD-dependent oxidoreductase